MKFKNKEPTGRGWLLIAAFILVALIYIALYVKDGFVRPFLGDVLAVIWLYALVRAVFGARIRLLPLKIFFFALALEMAQYFNLAQILGIQNKAVKIIIGSTFDALDILCYAVGSAVLLAYERVLERKI